MFWSQAEALDFRFDKPELFELKILFEKIGIDDLTTWFREWFEGERRKAEEEYKHLEEETRRREEEAQQKAEEEEHPEARAESKRVKPVERGGRSHGPIQDREKQQAQESKLRRPKPEVVCRKRERQWILAVEVPENLLENPGLVVLQNASPLIQDESSEGCWRLKQAFGEVVVRPNEDEVTEETEIALE